ncbi:MAG: 16S rRNA (cytosine(1402)-N(4))-methyltransferase RsmH [Candidatus Peribacteraceae bacterium]|nr:16S rRNA (cytosine(1402)-N(4))-methyltransferase RsmH [Candidatus Peribacteraceae bacterium]MDD5742436.1 16S rRNA (cytosine(1402)-N(4))-methyltransferase RsmH [Candidatus Peribacteraceae bacterium]
MDADPKHTPVLLSEVLSLLDPKAGETVLDATLGLGGHAMKFLERIGAHGRLIGLDADAQNLAQAQQRFRSLPGHVECRHENFRNIARLDLPEVDILFADLGLSSPHVDEPERGFTFRADVALDLRFDHTQGLPAAEWLRKVSLDDLTRVFREYGELKSPRRLAGKLKESEVTTTFSVVRVVEAVFGWKAPSVMPQVFQALRIAVNDEMSALDALLAAGPLLLKPGGRMGVISYHSLEDRRVKQVFRILSTAPQHPETGQDLHPADFALLTRKAVVPSGAEQESNARSRSAKLRVIMRRSSAPS